MKNSVAIPAISTIRNPIKLTLLGLLGYVVNLTPLHAGVIFAFDQVGTDVVATTSGTIASGWGGINPAFTQTYTSDRGVLAFDSIRAEVNGGKRYYNIAGGWTKNNNMSGVLTNTSGVVTGDAFGYAGSQSLILPAAVNVGDAFTPNTTITWANETFASLKLDTALSTTPLVLFTLDNSETISAVLTSGPTAVPEPSSFVVMLLVGAVATFGLRYSQTLCSVSSNKSGVSR